jgi:putative transposase
VVRGLQGRVQARQQAVLLSAADYRSRYLLACEGLSSTRSDFAFSVFERTFKDFGLPEAIRTDNGTPFASGNALFELSKLAVWWLKLAIQIQRIKPGCPQQNGRHERMHLTLKKEATRPASFNFLQQQERFDRFTTFTITSGPIRPWVARIPATSIHLRPESTRRPPSRSTPTMTGPSA